MSEELAFYGDVDFIPTEQYTSDDAQRAYDEAAWVVTLATRVIGPYPRQQLGSPESLPVALNSAAPGQVENPSARTPSRKRSTLRSLTSS